MLVSPAMHRPTAFRRGSHMPDTPKKPEQAATEKSAEKIGDLPNKPITENDAQTVKGGRGTYKDK